MESNKDQPMESNKDPSDVLAGSEVGVNVTHSRVPCRGKSQGGKPLRGVGAGCIYTHTYGTVHRKHYLIRKLVTFIVGYQ